MSRLSNFSIRSTIPNNICGQIVVKIKNQSHREKEKPSQTTCLRGFKWLREQDLNLRPSGYEQL